MSSKRLTKRRSDHDESIHPSEAQQSAQRKLELDLHKLRCLASSLLDGNPICVHVDKLNSEFSRGFLLTMDNGCKLIARIPCTRTEQAFLASEVATLKYLRQYTSLPVPNVLAWNSDKTNEIGSEYLIIEKTPGVVLKDLWGNLSTLDRYSIIEKIVAMETELANLDFPAFGALYLRGSASAQPKYYPLASERDCGESFCVGPIYKLSQTDDNTESSGELKSFGPWLSFENFASYFGQQQVTTQTIRQSVENKFQAMTQVHFDPIDETRALLEKASILTPILTSDNRVQRVSKPTLWHSGLPLDDILVSATQPTNILGIIGWQSAKILPLFLQAQFPKFLGTSRSHKLGDSMPSLSGFAELSPEQKQSVLQNQDTAARTRYYEMCIFDYNNPVYEALNLDPKLTELYRYYELSTEGDILGLYSYLISVSAEWDSLGLSGDCPFQFTSEELVQFQKQHAQFSDALNTKSS
ncbi:hypothetical protein BP00DRAFT_424218 [Aspergillus indologenus CBS 114.80]|uniref:Altered inheritance of mitochondria protein 9, mitochondrial n=1 Tax=Aspergillus indologenus CBS 114.80 TaxID=1450541 RepID=A0A2V5I8L2_9EURO|nr:hypothetical protein BP00DRAFT_424218 [Aspergillus indologenus CBS 114.80]